MRPVHFTKTHDGLSLAWSRSGMGTPLVKVAAWLTHLEFDFESPVWSHWAIFLERNFDFVRYDERGCGLSDRATGQLDLESWTDDLERIIEAASPPQPFVLFAMSQGTGAAVNYAAKYPERVSHLILIGGYARGPYFRGDEKAARLYRAVADIFRAVFVESNLAFREVFTRRFVPTGKAEESTWFNDLCRSAASAELGAEPVEVQKRTDASTALSDTKCPTIVLHPINAAIAPLSEERFPALNTLGTTLQVFDSSNHILQTNEPAWGIAYKAAFEFGGTGSERKDFGTTPREQAILDEICNARSNKIA